MGAAHPAVAKARTKAVIILRIVSTPAILPRV
jgi:hypothetical protein